MPKTIIGNIHNMQSPIVGIVAKNPIRFLQRGRYVYVGSSQRAKVGYKGYVLTDRNELSGILGRKKPLVSLTVKEDSDALRHGDILMIREDGTLMVIWSHGARGNALFISGACNCHCIMCPQPPTMHSKELIEVNKTVLELIDEDTSEICITGGEPTVVMNEFIEILGRCNKKFPNTSVFVLSNGIKLADFNTAKLVATARNVNICYCIPLYSDIDDIHDKITGSPNSFYLTAKGLQNLALLGISVEVRHVITRMNCGRLPNFSEFVYRNFPFVSHVALMGMEMTGLAAQNADDVWVDPSEYRGALAKAVRVLERGGVPVSVYNHQLCILENETHKVARRSISDWKNSYLPVCDGCMQKTNCGGFFETSGAYRSQAIQPLK